VVGGGHHHQADPSGVVPELVGGGEKAGFGKSRLRFLRRSGLAVTMARTSRSGPRHQRCVEDLAGKPVPISATPMRSMRRSLARDPYRTPGGDKAREPVCSNPPPLRCGDGRMTQSGDPSRIPDPRKTGPQLAVPPG